MYIYNDTRTCLINTDNVVSYGFHHVNVDSFETNSELIRIAIISPKYEVLCVIPEYVDPRMILEGLIHEVNNPENKNKIVRLQPHMENDQLCLFYYY